MKRNLCVAYADGREDVYPVAEGQSVLGADPSCRYGIQAEGVADMHLVFTTENGALFVVNLRDASSARLNGIPLNERCRFDFGDELAVGSVRIRLSPFFQEGEDLAESPDGVAEISEGLRSAGKAGWRGYRRILEWASPFISPKEAETAEHLHRSGLRALLASLVFLLCFAAAVWWLNAACRFRDSEICECVTIHLGLFLLLSLTVRYRIRCAGRLFALFAILDAWKEPPTGTWMDFFSIWGPICLLAIPCLYLWGWGLDVGAGCIFRKRPVPFLLRYLLLVACSGLVFGLNFLPGNNPLIDPRAFLPLVAMAALFPLWGRFVPRKWTDAAKDVSFVAEQASLRTGRMWTARVLTVFAVATPLFFVLAALGVSERLDWDEHDRELVVSRDGGGAPRAWYWELRGRFFRKSDIDQSLIFMLRREQLAEGDAASAALSGGDEAERERTDALEEPDGLEERAAEIEREFVDAEGEPGLASLNRFGKDLCRQVARIRLAPTNEVFFHSLEASLEPWRMSTAIAGDFQSAPQDFVLLYLEETGNRSTAESGTAPAIYHAQIRMGMRALSREEARNIALHYEARVVPALVLLCLGLLFLWKRATDSPVGFWLGIAFVANAFGLFMNDELNLLDAARYQLWHFACASTAGGLVAGWFATVNAAVWGVWGLSLVAQLVLFVLLCWPRPQGRGGGTMRRTASFAGKLVLLGLCSIAMGVCTALVVEYVEDNFFSLPEKLQSCALVSSIVMFQLLLGIAGAWMRRTRRFDSEVPDLGWEFFFGWIVISLSIWPVLMPELLEDSLMAGLVAGVSAVLGGGLFLRLCLRRNFLAVMTGTEFTFALLTFSIPVFAEVCESLVEQGFHGAFSFLQSENGVRILSVAVIVVFLAPIWRLLRKLTRRLSVKNLVRVEADVEKTLESLFDSPDTGDVHDEVFRRLGDLGLPRYAFFGRTSADGFVLLQKKDWPEHTPGGFRISPYLRHFLGLNRHVIEEEHLALDRKLLFQSFELARLFKRIRASCLMPICLGNSVRAILATPADRDGRPLPNDGAFLENITALGLAAIESMDLPPEGQDSPSVPESPVSPPSA